MKKLLAAGCAMAAIAAAQAEVKLASVFGDKMVLQRNAPIRVWGVADAGEKVTVEFAGKTATAVAGADGKWRLELPALPASKEGREFKAKGAANEVTFKDVLVGEVWFASGQSNMNFYFCSDNPHNTDEYGPLVAQMTRKPLVRYAATSNYKWSVTPKENFERKVEWREFIPENLAGPRTFSAVAVYYALELHTALDVPVAVLGSYWGGTRIEPWVPRSGFEQVESCKAEAAYKPAATTNDLPANVKHFAKNMQQQPMVLWNEMVEPWTPYTMKGFIWYQGCSNAGEYKRYSDMMHALYRGWAKEFENPDLKLYFVQLAPWGDAIIPHIQEAQAKFDAEEPNAGMAVICDSGNLKDIHPNRKLVVAKRLAVHALKRDYGFDWITDNSPTVKSWEVKDGKVTIKFNDADGWYMYHPDWSVDSGFEIAGADGKFVPADIENLIVKEKKQYRSNGAIKGADLILSAKGVPEPKMVRYLHSAPWYGALYSKSGLPLGAFHLGY